jgi:hypothetical protein
VTRPLSRTLDHPSPPFPRDPSWTFGCWPPCRPFHAYAPKLKFVFQGTFLCRTPSFGRRNVYPVTLYTPPHISPAFRDDRSDAGRRPAKLTCTESRRFCFFRYILVSARPPFPHETSSQDFHAPTPHFPSVSGRTFERWQPISPLRSEADFFL